jgi:hypothetical protein
MTNLMKTTAFAAAIALAGTAATAESYFGQQYAVDGDSAITLELVTAENAGMVAIYDYTGGEFGDLLGMVEVNAGANDEVVIPLDNNIAKELAAVLYAGEITTPGESAAWIELEVEDS